ILSFSWRVSVIRRRTHLADMASESGWLNPTGEAFVAIAVVRGHAIDCLIDTGFTGDLLLPFEFAEEYLLPVTGEQACRLAGGARSAAFRSLLELTCLGRH